MIDRSLISGEKLLDALLDSMFGNVNHWLRLVEIVPDYVPPFPREGTRPSIQVRCLVDPTQPLPAPGVATHRHSYLRFSRGCGQGYFWDLYGDAFVSVEHALLAVVRAPVPPSLLKRLAWMSEDDMRAVAAAHTERP